MLTSASSSVSQAEAPRGWRSAEAKRRFTWKVVLIAVACAGLQIGVLIVGVGQSMWRTVTGGIAYPEVAGAAVQHGRVWYVEYATRSDGSRGERLASINLDDNLAPEVGPDLPKGSRYVVADEDALWLLGTHDLARYEAGTLAEYSPPRRLYWPTPPVVVGDRTALFDWYGGAEVAMLVLDDGRLVRERRWYLPVTLPQAPTAWAALAEPEGGVDFFIEFRGDLRWRHVASGAEIGDPQSWEQVTDKAGGWTAARIDGAPIVVQTTHDNPFAPGLRMLRRRGGAWISVATMSLTTMARPGVVARPGGGYSVIQPEVGRVAVADLKADGFGEVREHGQGMFPIDWRWIAGAQAVGWLVSLPMALALTWMMQRARPDVHTRAGARARFASVFERGIALTFDGALVAALSARIWWGALKDPTRLASPRRMLALIGAAFACWLLMTLIASLLEGRWGFTPGKWLLGIRVVGTDLAPCGFGRAVVRNVLRVFDALLSFAIGMVFVAFTAEWQRLGDVAARTVVIRRGA